MNPYPMHLSCFTEELGAQLQDLQESNETVVSSLHDAERKIAELSDENKALRMQRPYDSQDIEDENRTLREEVTLHTTCLTNAYTTSYY